MATAPVVSSFEDVVRLSSGEQIMYKGSQIASYLLNRAGKPLMVVRFRRVTGSKTFVRIFSPKTADRGSIGLVPWPRIFCSRLSAFILRRRYGRNAILAPPPRFLRGKDSASDGPAAQSHAD